MFVCAFVFACFGLCLCLCLRCGCGAFVVLRGVCVELFGLVCFVVVRCCVLFVLSCSVLCCLGKSASGLFFLFGTVYVMFLFWSWFVLCLWFDLLLCCLCVVLLLLLLWFLAVFVYVFVLLF